MFIVLYCNSLYLICIELNIVWHGYTNNNNKSYYVKLYWGEHDRNV